MRAVAVLAVFADHLFAWPRGGFVGVDVFFVLSGFFITGMLIRERNETGTVSFRTFYIRRVRRIIPSALLVLTITVIAGYIVFPAIRARETLVDALWAAVFGANIHFEKVGTDYFQEGQPPSPLQHYWSLSIEEQFYFVWPILLLGIYIATRRRHRRGNRNIRMTSLIVAMGGIVAVSFAFAVFRSATEPASAYFSTFTRVWELGIGALVAICAPLLVNLPSRLRPYIAYLGLAGVAASFFVIDAESQFPGPWAALPVVSTALIIAAFSGGKVVAMRLLTNRVAGYFGATSYTLYLWHWPVIVLLAAIIPDGTLTFYVIALVVAFALTHLTYTLFEDPIRRSDWLENSSSKRRDKFTIPTHVWGLVGLVAVAAAVMTIVTIQADDRNSRASEASEMLVVPDTAGQAVPLASCEGAAAIAQPGNGCVRVDESKPLTPSIDIFAKDTQGAFSCWAGRDDSIRACRYGPDGADAVRIALIGDSHAASMLPGLSTQLTANNWNLTTYLGDGCRWALGISGACVDEVERIQQEEFLQGDPYDVIITTASRRWGGLDTNGLSEKISATWAPVLARGTKVVAIADNPEVGEDVISCMTRFGADLASRSQCSSSERDATARIDPLIAAVELSPGAALVDQSKYFCIDGVCPAVIGNVIVYRDTGGHVTATYEKSLWPMLGADVSTAAGL